MFVGRLMIYLTQQRFGLLYLSVSLSLQAHAFSSPPEKSWTSKDGSVTLSAYTVASSLDRSCGTDIFKPGLTIHEYMHTIGLVDLYDGLNPDDPGIGAFCIMAYPFGALNDATNPGHLCTWSRQEVGYVHLFCDSAFLFVNILLTLCVSHQSNWTPQLDPT